MEEARFERYLACAPTYTRIAKALGDVEVSSKDRRVELVHNIMSLAKETSVQLHFPGESPVDGRCLVQT